MSSQEQGDALLRIALVVLAVIVLVPLLTMMVTMPMMGMMGAWGGGSPGMRLSPLWGVGMLLVFLLILLGIGYVLYRGLGGGQDLGPDRALEELRTAYARGDLTDEEFEERRERLQRDRE